MRRRAILVLITVLSAPLLAANDKTTINLSNKSGAVGETITLEASLLSAPPNPNANVLGREIKFLVDGKGACTGKVAFLNLASCTWKVPTLTRGPRPLEARFAGDGTWAASKASAQVLIAKAPTKLDFGPTTDQKVVPGGSLEFPVYLKRTTDHEAVEGRVVSFNVDGQPAGKGRTGYGGSAYLEYSVPPHFPGDVNVEALFEGDDTYVASSARHSFPAPPKPGATILSLKCGGGLTVVVHVLIENPSGIRAFGIGATWVSVPSYDVTLPTPFPTHIDRTVTLDERSRDVYDQDHQWVLRVEGPGIPTPILTYQFEPRGADGKQRCQGHFRPLPAPPAPRG